MNHKYFYSAVRSITGIIKLYNFHRYYQLSSFASTKRYTKTKIIFLKCLPTTVFKDLHPCPTTQRCFTTGTGHLKEILFEDIKKLAKNKNTVIIDVREPDELFLHGVIPGSINVPLGELEKALRDMSDDNFFKRYGSNKPNKDYTVIFSCRSGRRSKEAQILALQLGYKNVMNYLGGWMDWVEKSKT